MLTGKLFFPICFPASPLTLAARGPTLDLLQTSESDVYRRQILTSEVTLRTKIICNDRRPIT